MPAYHDTHPSADSLRAFALGKRNDSSTEAILNHLDACPDCCKQVSALCGDGFLQRLRQARDHSSTSAPIKALSETAAGPNSPAGPPAIADLPPELASHSQYEILRELGRGGMGVVYLAKNKLMDRLEVLKVINKTLLDHPGAVERFLREIRAAAKLSHANVVGAYSVVQMGELLAFAMEYIEGQDLASLVKSRGPLPIPNACYYAQQAALGLQHASEKGMVHRDIKPQNLILAREGKKHIVKVLDFGLAKATREKKDDTGLTGEGKMLGTPDYIAPEQMLDAAKADIRADVYSLGCTLYYLLSGTAPFKAGSLTAVLLAHQMQEAKPLNLVRPEVPEELAAVVRKMMAKLPAKRYQTPLEVVQALAPFVRQGAMPKRSPESSSGSATVKPAVKIAPPIDPPPAAAAEVPKSQPEPAALWESLTEESIAPAKPRKSGVVSQPAAVAVGERAAQKKWLIGGSLGVVVVLLMLLGLLANRAFVKPKGDTVLRENEPTDAAVAVDGEQVTFPKVPDTEPRLGEQETVIEPPPPVAKPVAKQSSRGGGKAPRPKPPSPGPSRVVKPLPPAPNQSPKSTGFTRLFNGKDLTGWKVFGGGTGNWKVSDGILVGSGPMSHLFSERGDYENFHYLIEAMISDGGNSGQYFRTQFGPLFPKGYEAQIDSTGRDPKKTGSLYGIVNVAEQLHKPDEWFTQEVVADGDHIVIKVNDKTVVDTHDSRYKRGHFALQQHDSASVVKFRKIEIKELPGGTSAPSMPDGAISEAQEAAKAYEKASGEARAKLLTDFDAALARIGKGKSSTNLRLKMIEIVKEEKKRFENRGLIPWSEPMRPSLGRYFASISAAEGKLRRAYLSLINVQLKAKKESTVAVLQSELTNLLTAKLLAKWRVVRDGRQPGYIVCLYSNGRIYGTNGNATKGTWMYSNGVVILRWPDPKAPGGAWLDSSNVSVDGTAYAGTNNAPPASRAKFTGIYVDD